MSNLTYTQLLKQCQPLVKERLMVLYDELQSRLGITLSQAAEVSSYVSREVFESVAELVPLSEGERAGVQFGASSIDIIKAIRERTGCSLIVGKLSMEKERKDGMERMRSRR